MQVGPKTWDASGLAAHANAWHGHGGIMLYLPMRLTCNMSWLGVGLPMHGKCMATSWQCVAMRSPYPGRVCKCLSCIGNAIAIPYYATTVPWARVHYTVESAWQLRGTKAPYMCHTPAMWRRACAAPLPCPWHILAMSQYTSCALATAYGGHRNDMART